MQPGSQKRIEYIGWDGAQWLASLEDIRQQGGPMPGTIWTTDPDFLHYNADGSFSHQEKWIRYKSWDGSHWASQAHTHTNIPGWVNFTFEHFKAGNLGHADHEDATLNFLAWDGSKWQLSVDKFKPPPYGVSFQLKRF